MDAPTLRGTLRGLGMNVVARLEGTTGLPPGPGAERLVDQLVTVYAAATKELGELYLAELDQADTAVHGVNDNGPGLRLAPDFRIGAASLPETVAVFNATAPNLHGRLAEELLADARSSGAAGDVVEYVQLMADADVTEGIYAITWPTDVHLPAPGEDVMLGAEFPETVRGKAKVVGFGRTEGSLRVRPYGPGERYGPELHAVNDEPDEESDDGEERDD